MRYLISREKFINEHLHIDKQSENKDELYEGLISTVFGGLKMLLKKDWANIKCKNPTVLEHLKEIDKSLSGYTMTKMQFYSECNIIRQNVADYYNDILDYKLLQIEKEDNIDKFIDEENENEEDSENKGVDKYLNLKDETLLDSLKKYRDNISSVCKKSSKLKEYAEQLLNAVVVIVNDIVISELEKKGADKKKLEAKKKKLEEKQKELDEIRNKMNAAVEKADEKALKKLSDERDQALRDINVKPIGNMGGDKTIDVITKQFSDMMGEFNGIKLNESKELPKSYVNIMRSDTYLGIQDSLKEIEWNFDEHDNKSSKGFFDKFLIKVILNKIDTVFKVVSKNKLYFKGVPSASVQAMLVSLSNAVIYGFLGKNRFDIENDTNRISLITKCVIDSDATIGFNLPLLNAKDPDEGNFFVSIMNQFKSADISSKEIEDVIKSMSEDELKMMKKDVKKHKVIDVDIDIKDVSKTSKDLSSKLMKDFRQNMTELFDIILKEADKIKNDKKQQTT